MSDEQARPGPVSSRRALIIGAGAVGLAVALAGCGDDAADGDDTARTTDGAGADMKDSGSGTVLARVSDIPVGGGVIFAAQSVVVAQPTAGTFRAFSAICTHQQCPLISVSDGLINCGCHGSQFAIEDGSVRGGPATKPLPVRQVRIEGDDIILA